MKHFLLFLFATLLCSLSLEAEPSSSIYSISCAPGQDASKSMGISWATDSTLTDSYVLYTLSSDSEWKHAKKAKAEQREFCTVFDGVWSDDIHRNPIYENARFFKCGTTLSKLKKDSDYKYVICGSEGERSRVGHFRTAGAQEWSCCLISDFHSKPASGKKLVGAMKMIDTVKEADPSLDWVLSAGDVVSWGGSYSFWKAFFEAPNCANMMWARVNGNHDNWTKESEETHDYDIPNSYFKGTSYFPRNGYGDELGVCYYFRYGNALFVMLNTEDMDDGAEFEQAAHWTREVVTKEKAGKNPPTFTVVCMHYEWFLGTNGKTSEYGRWHKVFDELGVDLAYAGNNHVYLRSYPIYQDKVAQDGRGTVYLQTPASDNDRGRSIDPKKFRNQDKICFRWTEGSKSIGAIHMSVTKDLMTLSLMDRNGNVIDTTEIKAK